MASASMMLFSFAGVSDVRMGTLRTARYRTGNRCDRVSTKKHLLAYA
jgi:hypothetical protein